MERKFIGNPIMHCSVIDYAKQYTTTQKDAAYA